MNLIEWIIYNSRPYYTGPGSHTQALYWEGGTLTSSVYLVFSALQMSEGPSTHTYIMHIISDGTTPIQTTPLSVSGQTSSSLPFLLSPSLDQITIQTHRPAEYMHELQLHSLSHLWIFRINFLCVNLRISSDNPIPPLHLIHLYSTVQYTYQYT